MVVEQGQCLMDVAIQHGGDATALLSLALANGISITEDVPAGTMLLDIEPLNKPVANYFKDKNIIPATATEVNSFLQQQNNGNSGISVWEIGVSFIVGG